MTTAEVPERSPEQRAHLEDLPRLLGSGRGPGRESPLGVLAARSFGRLPEVDLGRHVGRLGHDDDLVGTDLEEAAGDGESSPRPGRLTGSCSLARRRAG